MLAAFRQLLPIWHNRAWLAAALALVLPLATPTLAESMMETGSERETTTNDSQELLAWVHECRPSSRGPQVGSAWAFSPPLCAACRKPGQIIHPPLSGHRLSCGIMAPLRC